MPRTVEQIEADIAAVTANPNWTTDPVDKVLYGELLREKYQLTPVPVPPPIGKY